MINSIANIGASAVFKSADNKEAAPGFADMFKDMVKQTNQLQSDADTSAMQFATGQVDNAHDVMIATEKASLSMSLTLQVRNKLLDAYQEIMRMQV